MTSTSLHNLSIRAMTDGFAAGSFSPVDVTRALFDAIEADTHGINPFVQLDPGGALIAAEASAQRWQGGKARGPLDGVPVSIKDLSHVAGWPTRRGSLATAKEPVPTTDAPAVKLLRDGGAVVFGKTATSEYGWAVISESPHSGITRNPHALGHTSGGSSSGAAAQVAAGWGPLALGSDAGGSVRIPASYCGIVALKPTYAAIPQPPQSPLAEYVHLGPLVRSVADCRVAMQVLAGADVRDPASLFPRAATRLPDRPLRIAVAARFGKQALLDPAIEAAFARTVEQVTAFGHTVHQLNTEWLDTADDAWNIWASRIHESFCLWDDGQRALLDPRLLRVYRNGGALTLTELSRSRTRLRDASNRMAAVFAEFDFLLTPATATPALPLGRLAPDAHPRCELIETDTGNWFDISPYTYLFNMTHQPALVLPMGKTGARLPFGLQIVGQRYADDALLDFGETLEPLLASGGPYAPAIAPEL